MARKKMSLAQKVNILRASVMGANDGIISIAGIVIGVAAATNNAYSILISGLSGTLAGMISMCMGEYVSVSTQKDSQKMALISERQRLDEYQEEFNYVQQKYEDQDIDPKLAKQATKELMDKDALSTVVQERYGFNPKELTSPYAAAIASFISFPTGSVLPMLAVTLAPAESRILATAIAVLIALLITGYCAAILSNSNRLKSSIRNAIAGLLTMGVTYIIGQLLAH